MISFVVFHDRILTLISNKFIFPINYFYTL